MKLIMMLANLTVKKLMNLQFMIAVAGPEKEILQLKNREKHTQVNQ